MQEYVIVLVFVLGFVFVSYLQPETQEYMIEFVFVFVFAVAAA